MIPTPKFSHDKAVQNAQAVAFANGVEQAKALAIKVCEDAGDLLEARTRIEAIEVEQ